MKCPYPAIDIPPQFVKLASEDKLIQNPTRTRRSYLKASGGDFDLQLENEQLDFYIEFKLDDFTEHKNLTGFIVFALQPEFFQFANTLFLSHSDRVSISGKRLDHGIQVLV